MAKGQKTGGRVKGVPNKATRDIKEVARSFTPQAMKTLVALLGRDDSPAAQLGAARELLDRGYGKATQPIAGDDEGAAIRVINEIVLRGVRSDQDH